MFDQIAKHPVARNLIIASSLLIKIHFLLWMTPSLLISEEVIGYFKEQLKSVTIHFKATKS